MPVNNLPVVFTPDEIAEYLKLDRQTVEKEMVTSRLKGFKAGNEWRCTEQNLINYVNRGDNPGIPTEECGSTTDYQKTDFTKLGPFDFAWPSGTEAFEYGFETIKTLNGRRYTFKIGFTNREAAGQMRRRIVVWMNNWPMVEFASGNNYENDKLYVSVIKVGGRQVRPFETTPAEYNNFRVAKYDSIVKGPYASTNKAVIVNENDLDSMIHHAIIRAVDKQMV